MDRSELLSAHFRELPGSHGWASEVTPPLPERWPDEPLIYYAFARRFRPTLFDGQDVAAPWAKVDERGNVTLLTARLNPDGIEGIRPMNGDEIALLKEVQSAGTLEELWRRAPQDAAIALLLRRWYSHWSKVRTVSRHVLARHPELAAFLAHTSTQ